MKRLTTILMALVLSGCVTNGQIDYGKTALAVAGVVAVGMIAANDSSDEVAGEDCFIVVRPDGTSSQVCR